MKILVGGDLYGYHNVGDEAILESIILNFQKEAELSVLTNEDYWITKDYTDVNVHITSDIYENSYLYPRGIIGNVKKAFCNRAQYKNVDYFCMGGATSMSDFPYHALGEIQVAAAYGVKSFIWGAGIVPVDDEHTRKYIRKVCNSSSVLAIYVRDEYCKKRLSDMGVDPDKIDFCYDPVIMLEGKGFDERIYFTADEIQLLKDNRKNIVVSISGENDAIQKTDNFRMAEMINELSKLGNVILIPTGFAPNCEDLKCIKQIINKKVKNLIVVEKEFRARHLIEFLKCADVVITSRLHMSIFSACADTPFVALKRSEKNEDFAEIMGMKCFELNNMPVVEVVGETKNILQHQHDFEKIICSKKGEMRKRHQYASNLMKNLLLVNMGEGRMGE